MDRLRILQICRTFPVWCEMVFQSPGIIRVKRVHPGGVPEPIVRFGQVGRQPPVFDSCGHGNRPPNSCFRGSIQYLGGSTERFVIVKAQMAVGVKHMVPTINRGVIFYPVENQNQRLNSLDLKRAKL